MTTRLAALRDLERRLASLKRQRDEAPGGDEASKRRLHAHLSLVAVIDFLDEIGLHDLTGGLQPLVSTLFDIENGRAPPDWLKNSAPHAPRPPIDVAAIRGRCAAIMELLMKAGHGREAAARFIFNRLPAVSMQRLAPQGPQRSRTWRTVAAWRDAVTGSADDSPERQGYIAMLEFAGQAGIDVNKEAPRLLEIFAQRALSG